MIRDALLTFSNAQAVTAAAASTNLIDLRSVRDMGVGEPLFIVTVVTVAMTDAASNSTLARILETDTLAAFGSPVTAQTLGTIPAISAAGTMLVERLGPFAVDEQFLRMFYTPANGDLTTGSFTSFICSAAHLYTAYGKGYEIDH